MTKTARDAELRRVYRAHVKSVFAFFASAVERHTAEDLTAATFERVVGAWDRYDPARGSEGAWIMTIAHRLLTDHFRRQRFRTTASLDEYPFLADALVGDDTAPQRLEHDELRAWLACLGERDRMVIALRYGADLTAADIGAALGLSAATVHTVISRALGRLRREAQRSAAPAASPTARGASVSTLSHYARAHRNPTFGLALALVLAAAALAVAPAPAPAAMQVGFYDPVFLSANPLERGTWFDRVGEAGGQVVRFDLRWALVAPTPPARPDDPTDPAYRWAAVDAAVADATARGLRVVLTLTGAPPWAEQGPRPDTAAPGSWQPDPKALGVFAGSAARRYRGAVHAWQIWNEPNLSLYLAPQYKNGRTFAPARYRSMLNAASRAIKGVDPSNLIVTAGTAPYGDPLPGGNRIMPARFWRDVLCLSGPKLKRRSCPAPARFDALAHHPYGVRGPNSHARNADDVAVPDLGKLTRILRAAVRRRTVFPARAKQLWVTEIAWDSSPPDPDGVPAARYGEWVAGALRVLQEQGTDVMTWFRIRDQAPVPSFGATNQSGLYLVTGEPKPALNAWVAAVNRIKGTHRAKRSAVRSACTAALKASCATAHASMEGAP